MLEQQVGRDEVGVDDSRDAHPAAGALLHSEGIGQQRLAEAAVLLRNRQPEQAELLEPLDDLGRVLVAGLKITGDRQDLLVHEDADRLEDLYLDVTETVGLAE